MTYTETVDYIMSHLPMFQRLGSKAFKNSLTNILQLCEMLENPERNLKTVHVGGTNGKGSSSHLIAAILQSAGYKTGLFTSPHLKNFTERIKINGEEIGQDFVVQFISKHRDFLDKLQPTFFEMSVALAFDYFYREKVDIAVIEVGLGGRLDSTNVIEPEVSLITNISYDHQVILGETLPQIAGEKAGIIKAKTPVVISQYQDDLASIFQEKASSQNAPIYFANQNYQIQFESDNQYFNIFKNTELHLSNLVCELKGNYQAKNLLGVIQTIDILRQKGWNIENQHISNGFANIVKLTGLKGRWQTLQTKPLMICDTGHNEDGIKQVINQLETLQYEKLHFVLGTVNDKDLSKILIMLPKDAQYYFCKPNIPRGLETEILKQQAEAVGLQGEVFESVSVAIRQAKANAKEEDLIFIGGSTFVVAEVEEL